MFEMCCTDQQRAKVPFESVAASLTQLYISPLFPALPVLAMMTVKPHDIFNHTIKWKIRSAVGMEE